MTIEAARGRGLNLQAARGHAPREHVIREERRAARGALSERERVWARRQAKRLLSTTPAEFYEYLEGLPAARRAEIIARQQYRQRQYRRSWNYEATEFPDVDTIEGEAEFYH